MCRHCGLDGDGRTERKTGQPQRIRGVPGAHPFDRCQRIIQLTHALIVVTFAFFRAAKIKTQDLMPGAHEGTRQRMYHLVVHGAAVLGMRVTNHRTTLQRTLSRTLDNRFQPADRAVDEVSFANWMLAH